MLTGGYTLGPKNLVELAEINSKGPVTESSDAASL